MTKAPADSPIWSALYPILRKASPAPLVTISPTNLLKFSLPCPTVPPNLASAPAFSVMAFLYPSRLRPDSMNCCCSPDMPLAVSPPTCASSLNASLVFCSWSRTNLAPSAATLTPASNAPPMSGTALARAPSPELTASIIGLS